jgi:hypothetical protein
MEKKYEKPEVVIQVINLDFLRASCTHSGQIQLKITQGNENRGGTGLCSCCSSGQNNGNGWFATSSA